MTTESNQHDSKNDKQNSSDDRLIITSNSDKENAKHATEQYAQQEKKSLWGTAAHIANVVIAICTIALVIFTAIQIRATVASLNLQSIRDSLSIRSQQIQDSISLEVSHVTLRPYMVIGDFVGSKIDTNKCPSIKWSIKNTGQTPAINAALQRGFKIGTGMYDSDWMRLRKEVSVKPNGGSVVGNGIEYKQGEICIENSIRNDEFLDMKNRRKFLYYFGIISYDDMFGIHHETIFCMDYDFESGKISNHDGYNSIK